MIQSMATERWDATISLSNKTTLYHMTRIPHLDHTDGYCGNAVESAEKK